MALESLEQRVVMSAADPRWVLALRWLQGSAVGPFALQHGSAPPAVVVTRDPVLLNAAAPKNLQVVSSEDAPRLRLQWTDNIDGEGGFTIERSLDGGKSFTPVTNVAANVESFTDAKLRPDTVYTYRVRATGDGWVTSPTDTAAAETNQWTIVPVREFGATATTLTDDAAAIQAAIDAAAPGGTIVLEKLTYRLSRGLVINKPLTVEGNGATLLLNTSNHPQNRTLRIESQLGTAYEWTGAISNGATRLNVTVSPTTIRAGDTIFVGLGQDQYDANEEHFATLARVVSNDGTAIVIDTPVPYDIRQGTRKHFVRKVTSLAENVRVNNVKFDHVSGTIPDANIWVQTAKAVTLENITGRFSILANVADSSDVTLRNVNGTLTKPHPAAGRLLTAWQSSNVNVTNVMLSTAVDAPVVFLESWARGITIQGLTLTSNLSVTGTNATFHVAGGSTGAYFDDVVLHNNKAVTLFGTGGQAGSAQFGDVTIDGAIKSAPLNAIATLRNGSKQYVGTATVNRNNAIDDNWKDRAITVGNGAIKSLTISFNNARGVKGLYLINQRGQGINLTSRLNGGGSLTIDVAGFAGNDYPYNTLDAKWTLRVYTDGSVRSDAKVTVAGKLFVP